MLILAITFLIVSFVYALYVFSVKQMRLASNYTIFVFFSFIYSVFPALTVLGIEPKIWFEHWPLNESVLLVSTHVAIVAACLLIWAYVFHKRQRPLGSEADTIEPAHKGAGAAMVFLLYMAMCAALIALGAKYSYHSAGLSEMGHSGMSKAKVLLASVYVLYMARYGVDRRLVLMFFGFVALLLVEHSRWYFVSVLLATGFYLQNTRRITNRQVLIIGLIFLLLLSYVGLYRCQVPLTSFSLLLNPIFMEGDYGSYMVLQTYDVLYQGHMKFCTMFLDYLVDPAIYLLPRTIFISDNVDKETVGVFPYFVSSHEQYWGRKYAPTGGFNYLAQASSAFPFGGPLIITWLFALLTVWMDNKRNKSSLWHLTYYLYSAGFMFVFIKTRFDMTINYYVTLSVPAYMLYYIITHRRLRLALNPGSIHSVASES